MISPQLNPVRLPERGRSLYSLYSMCGVMAVAAFDVWSVTP